MKNKLIFFAIVLELVSGCKYNEPRQERVEMNYKVPTIVDKRQPQIVSDDKVLEKKAFNSKLTEPAAQSVVLKRKPVRIEITDTDK